MHNTAGHNAHVDPAIRAALTTISDRPAVLSLPRSSANDEAPSGPAPRAADLERARDMGILREQVRGGV